MKDRGWDPTKPLGVGGDSMLSTANYAARKFGVRSAMPGFIARKLCPQLAIVPSNFPSYRESSQKAEEIFKEYSDVVVMASLDEAYLDLTDHMIGRERSDTRQICSTCFKVTSFIRQRTEVEAEEVELPKSQPVSEDNQATPEEEAFDVKHEPDIF